MQSQIPSSQNFVQPEFHPGSTQKYVVTEEGQWRPAGRDEARRVNTKKTLESLSSRCDKILDETSATNEARNTQEIEQHLQNTLNLADKVVRHARRSWDWIPLIGKFFGNLAEANVREQFQPVVKKLESYLQLHGTDTLARSAQRLEKFNLKEVSHQTSSSQSGTTSWISGVARQVFPLAPMAQHVENLFRDGAKYGFHQEKLQYASEAEDILRARGGIDVNGTRFLYWRNSEDASTFHVSTLDEDDRVSQFTVAAYDKGKYIQYDFGDKAGRPIPSLEITKEHPNFPVPGERQDQSQITFIQKQLQACLR
jgi:hypothetical protein